MSRGWLPPCQHWATFPVDDGCRRLHQRTDARFVTQNDENRYSQTFVGPLHWPWGDRIIASSSMQWYHKRLGVPVFIILHDEPRFSSLMQPLSAIIHGEWGSVLTRWQSASRHFFANFPKDCSFELSATILVGTPSRLKTKDKVSWASDFCSIGWHLDHPNCVQYACP